MSSASARAIHGVRTWGMAWLRLWCRPLGPGLRAASAPAATQAATTAISVSGSSPSWAIRTAAGRRVERAMLVMARSKCAASSPGWTGTTQVKARATGGGRRGQRLHCRAFTANLAAAWVHGPMAGGRRAARASRSWRPAAIGSIRAVIWSP